MGGTQERHADQDHELVEALRLHEPTAAERLVATYGDRAYRLARGITGNAQDAEEVDAIRSAIRPRSRRPQRAVEVSHIPVVILTAHGDVETRRRSLQAGAVAFLDKPFRSEALLDAVRAALR